MLWYFVVLLIVINKSFLLLFSKKEALPCSSARNRPDGSRGAKAGGTGRDGPRCCHGPKCCRDARMRFDPRRHVADAGVRAGGCIVTEAASIVVGIGASAGGLDAFHRFFASMPPDSGLAFVVVPHLPANRESLLPEILGRGRAGLMIRRNRTQQCA